MFSPHWAYLPTLQGLETEGMARAQELESLKLRINTEEDRHTATRQEASKLKAKVNWHPY